MNLPPCLVAHFIFAITFCNCKCNVKFCTVPTITKLWEPAYSQALNQRAAVTVVRIEKFM